MDNVAIIRSAYEAFGRGDIEGVLEGFAPEIEWYAPETVGGEMPVRGVAGVGAFFAGLQETFAEIGLDLQELQPLGDDRVLALGVHHGRVHEGGTVEIPFAHVWTLADGRITRFREYADAVPVLRAKGALATAAA